MSSIQIKEIELNVGVYENKTDKTKGIKNSFQL